MNNTFAIVYAGHGNQLLGDLLSYRCVAGMPLAGRFRNIDFLFTNLADSGVRNVGLITQRNYQSLVEHVGSGAAWDMNKKQGGLAVLAPFDQGTGTELYRGFGDAMFAKRYFLNRQLGQYCLVLDTDVVYREDYNRMLDALNEKEADIVLLYSHDARLISNEVMGAARLDVDADGFIRGVDYSDEVGEDSCFSLGACLMDKNLLQRLIEDACAEGRYNFVTDVLEPALRKYKVAGVEHTGYAARISSVKSYFDISKDMIDPEVREELFVAHGPVHTRIKDAPPVRFAAGCRVEESVFGNGCDVFGRVSGSVVFRGVTIDRGADVKNCVVMQNARIGQGAHLRNAIIDKDVVVRPNARIVGTPDLPVVIRKGSIIEA
ncbi:Glucose-1-phosphate adenylyltransferase [Slackia heliotrinireducens]|uniref:Glucose-1-phosphate adenylyltransferase, GlgD subunit n=1 Tax=Slackia heliotrinireducens (strain ATCC 29202 / DSM 20476 / NCTC 11029 / RHS 1) TaxID=471855 RepID=C7N739_SLAHD|nr:glucose-1-phosphate adenylyltransferase subunit GlgD [Slackia heliotrinireducens]ACV22724.1 glucose-1-phosphate adenylyltransferase, GlgD subunit [Slackia heliotrinireducens DSM 20476]VEH01354.1 Glucose-1-phosphate adenylyltransferase [Slackia heliotrinireducens]